MFLNQVVAQEPSFRARSNLVPVPTMVRDARGGPVYGLRAEDFAIKDDDDEQIVHLDETPEERPLALVIAIQVGRRSKREFGRMHGLPLLLDAMLADRNSETALVLFDSQVSLAQNFTPQADNIEGMLRNLPTGDNGAAIVDAVVYAARLLGKRQDGRQRVLLLISETRDHGSHIATVDDAVQLIGNTDTQVFALAFSPYISQQLDIMRGNNQGEESGNIDILEKLAAARQAMRRNTPKALAEMSGGEYERFSSRKAFENDMTRFQNHLESRYLLSFQPKESHPGLHKIEVRLQHPVSGETLLFRRSYWASGGQR